MSAWRTSATLSASLVASAARTVVMEDLATWTWKISNSAVFLRMSALFFMIFAVLAEMSLLALPNSMTSCAWPCSTLLTLSLMDFISILL